MLKIEDIEVKITTYNYENYYSKYGPYENGDLVKVLSSDLFKSSAVKITAICNFCLVENKIRHSNYKLQINRGGYYCCKNCDRHKINETNLIKYGHITPLNNIEIREKGIKVLIDKYGVDNISKLNSIKNDRKDNFKTDNFKEKSKKTWISKYGVDNPSKANSIKVKKEETCLRNYGVSNPSQSSELFERAQKNGKKIKEHKCGLMYRGTYEKHFLDYCIDNSIIVEKGPTVQYIHNSIKRYYHSDFFIPKLNLICEIKSSYYYEKYLDVNISKRIYSELDYDFLFIIDKDYSKIKKED